MRWIITVFLLNVALGHANLVASTPAAGATITLAPATATLSFSENLEAKFYIFKVYPLSAAPQLWTQPAKLRQLASQLVPKVVNLKNDAVSRADLGPSVNGSNVALKLKPLKPGPYVVLWKNLSVDGHTSQGFYVFVYKP
jgi:copper resistance protein C